MSRRASPETDEDLIAGRDFIGADNEQAARDFVDADSRHPTGCRNSRRWCRARFKHRALKGVRFSVPAPPFNRWLIFYQPVAKDVEKDAEIKRVRYGNVNWREEPERFF